MRHIEEAVWLRLQQDQLSPEEEAAVFEHLADCPLCQTRYAEMLSPRMDELAELLLPDAFTDQTMERIHSSAPSGPWPVPLTPSVPSPFALRRQRLVAYAIAASLTLVLMGSGLFRLAAHLPHATPESSTPQPAATRSWTAKWESFAPLFGEIHLTPAAQQPLKIPPLRQLVERSSFHDKQK